MEKNDVDTILRSLPEVKKMLNLTNQFLKLLLDYRVFSKEMIEDIMRNECPPMELCTMLVKRGPKAYTNFTQALTETNQQEVLSAMERARSTLGQPAHHFIPPRSNNQEISSVDQNAQYNFLPIYSTSPPANSELYWRKVLEPPCYMESVPSPPDQRLQRLSSAVTDALPPDWENLIDIKVEMSTEVQGTGQDIYPNVHKKPRGFALILNFQEFVGDIVSRRFGSEKDVIHLDKLLQQLGYEVRICSNLTLVDTLEELDSFTKNGFHGVADSTVIAVMSHGKGGSHEEGTLIYTRDCRFISSEEILRRFNNVNCPLLKGKPKIFLFQFCRGDNIDVGVRAPQPAMVSLGRTVTDGNPVPIVSTEIERAVDDMLIAYSTLPGFVSYREESEGTWFIKALCLTFMKHAHECHIDRLFQIVDMQIKHWTGQKNGKQTLEITRRGFNHKFYFNPGLWV